VEEYGETRRGAGVGDNKSGGENTPTGENAVLKSWDSCNVLWGWGRPGVRHTHESPQFWVGEGQRTTNTTKPEKGSRGPVPKYDQNQTSKGGPKAGGRPDRWEGGGKKKPRAKKKQKHKKRTREMPQTK